MTHATKDAIYILKSEHRSLAVILAALKELARKVEEEAVQPDFRVFRAMLRYIDEYPERLHHPKEDAIIFERLASRSAEARRLVTELRSEHVAGARLIRDLERAMLFFEDRYPAGKFDFRVAVDDYAAFHFAHMRKEEEALLPLAARLLDAADWAAINAAFAQNSDPVSGVAEKDLRALFSRIAHLAPAPVGLGEPWR
jgi:hemerythrin-like domain-containing protein